MKLSHQEIQNLQPRARIFYENFGYWSNLDYIIWISRKKQEFWGPVSLNQEEFTEFLRGNPE